MIQLLVCDFDGVLTKGDVQMDAKANMSKSYHVHDATGLRRLKESGVEIRVLSGFMYNQAQQAILQHIGVDSWLFGVAHKEKVLAGWMEELNLVKTQVAYIGDGLNDIKALSMVGIAACPCDAHPMVRQMSNIIVTTAAGGNGCVREICEQLLRPNKPARVLDCTLRDGGIVNGWSFSEDFIRAYFQAIRNTVEYVELGYIATTGNGTFLSAIDLERVGTVYPFLMNTTVELVVIGDFGKFDPGSIPPRTEKIPVGWIRIVVSADDLWFRCSEVCRTLRELKGKGYQTSLNIMEASHITAWPPLIQHMAQHLTPLPDVLYVADSFGAMYPEDVGTIFHELGDLGVPLGFHGHNNIQMAYANARAAVKCPGVCMIDTTLCGFGKGAGNLPLELFRRGQLPDELLEFLSSSHFQDLRQKYTMGYTMEYGFTGVFDVSPRNAEYKMLKHQNASLLELVRHIKDDRKTRSTMPQSRVCCLIPARYNSQRLPAKLLLPVPDLDNPGGTITAIRRTCRQVRKCSEVFAIYVVTDHDDIEQEALKEGVGVLRVNQACINGTERIAIAYQELLPEKFNCILNVQGDEIDVDPRDLSNMLRHHWQHQHYCTCLHAPHPVGTSDSSSTKVTITKDSAIMYISRNVIPGTKRGDEHPVDQPVYIHLGVYVFSPGALRDFQEFKAGPIQLREDIELLKFMENGKSVHSFPVEESYLQLNTQKDYRVLMEDNTYGDEQTK